MIFKRKLIPAISLLICLVVTLISIPVQNKTVKTNANSHSLPCIILDAGPGGFDGGAVAADGTVEKNINLNICLSLYKFLISNGYKVILSRSDDSSTESNVGDRISSKKKRDLENRLQLMSDNPDAVFISIHLNKFTTSAARGSQVFYSANLPESSVLGEKIQASIVSMLQPENKRVNKKATSSTFLLYNATIPAVLVECGFLSNKAEREKLKTTQYQNKIAFCIFCGINEYFSNKKEL